LDSESWFATYGLAQLHWHDQEYDRALQLYRHAATLQPDLVLVQHDLGMALLHEGNFAEARAALQRALTLGLPEEQAAQVREYLTHLEEPRFRAEVEADLTCRRCADLVADGYFEEALPDLQQVVSDLPEQASAWYYLGLTYRGLQRPTEAAAALRQVLALEPDQADAHSDLSVVLMQLGDAEGAYQHAERAYRQQPGDPEIVRNFGLACLFAGRREEARWMLGLARRLAPHDPITRAGWEVLRWAEGL
jgi:tetratricopeptide (TPR) repeat protein